MIVASRSSIAMRSGSILQVAGLLAAALGVAGLLAVPGTCMGPIYAAAGVVAVVFDVLGIRSAPKVAIVAAVGKVVALVAPSFVILMCAAPVIRYSDSQIWLGTAGLTLLSLSAVPSFLGAILWSLRRGR